MDALICKNCGSEDVKVLEGEDKHSALYALLFLCGSIIMFFYIYIGRARQSSFFLPDFDGKGGFILICLVGFIYFFVAFWKKGWNLNAIGRCNKCKSFEVFPLDTPVGLKIKDGFHSTNRGE